MNPLISAAQRGDIHLYYVDAAHFVLGAFLGYLWCVSRIFIRTPSGRKRYNVLGAYNAITGAMVSVTNTTYINSSSVVELLSKLSLLHPEGTVKVILDNAAYQRCYWVRAFASLIGIELIFLPSYSPNLNLIERYWKFVKKKSLNNQFYSNFEDFCAAIDDCINNAKEKYHEEIESLMTLRFQTFENVKCLAG